MLLPGMYDRHVVSRLASKLFPAWRSLGNGTLSTTFSDRIERRGLCVRGPRDALPNSKSAGEALDGLEKRFLLALSKGLFLVRMRAGAVSVLTALVPLHTPILSKSSHRSIRKQTASFAVDKPPRLMTSPCLSGYQEKTEIEELKSREIRKEQHQ
jgi:hypothetical protein